MARSVWSHSRSRFGNFRWAFIWSSKALGPLPLPPFTADLPPWTPVPWPLWRPLGKVSRLDLGNWIFGALIAFNLLVLSALLTIGPVDQAVLIATATFALALPPDVAGFLLVRLAADMKSVDLEQVATQAFVEAGFEAKARG